MSTCDGPPFMNRWMTCLALPANCGSRAASGLIGDPATVGGLPAADALASSAAGAACSRPAWPITPVSAAAPMPIPQRVSMSRRVRNRSAGLGLWWFMIGGPRGLAQNFGGHTPSPQYPGERAGVRGRASVDVDRATRSTGWKPVLRTRESGPTYARPLTLTLSPGYWGEGTGQSSRRHGASRGRDHPTDALVVEDGRRAVGRDEDGNAAADHECFRMIDAHAVAAHPFHEERLKTVPASGTRGSWSESGRGSYRHIISFPSARPGRLPPVREAGCRWTGAA